jgi:dTDP-glucose 4,6-dehydratase
LSKAPHVLVTGAAGFIGSNLVERILKQTDWSVTAFDALTYAGNMDNLTPFIGSNRFSFILANICDRSAVKSAFERVDPEIVFHLAAESHVDRSIDAAADFITTNVLGTQIMLDCARSQVASLPDFRFIHISTDEVFGDLGPADSPFTEETSYRPSSPYAASKAASDHLVRAAFRTHGLPVLISNCSNNYGPKQFPEKLIPLMIINALKGLPLPVYGDGSNRRDWLHVEDHADALILMAQKGAVGQTYCVGGGAELSNLDVVRAIHDRISQLHPRTEYSLDQALKFVNDRPGHDRRYAVDAAKIANQLEWVPKRDFKTGLNDTIDWYLANTGWWEAIATGAYRGQRLGLGEET